MRTHTCLSVLFLVACAYGLYQVKYMVRDVKRDVGSLTAQLKDEQKKMHVLDAEWAHLIRPDRLEQLSGGHLGLVPVSVTQMQADIGVIPVRAVIIVPTREAVTAAAAPSPAPAGLFPTGAIQPVNYAR